MKMRDSGVAFQAGDERDAVCHERLIPCVVGESPVEDNHGAAGQFQGLRPGAFMGFAVGDIGEIREIAVGVKPCVQLDCPLGFTKLCPGKDGKAQINRGRVEEVKLAVELEAMPWSILTTPLQELPEKRFEE